MEAGIEQASALACFSIEAGSGRAFAQIATGASQGEIFRGITGRGVDVLYVHGLAGVEFPGVAILTAAFRPVMHKAANSRPG